VVNEESTGADVFEIARLSERALDPRSAVEIDEVFFASSTTRTFDSATERSAFRERWLGLYQRAFPETFLIGRDEAGRVAGYLAGAIVEASSDPRFCAHGFSGALGPAAKRYPAHFHINIGADWRSRGLGARLVSMFRDDCRAAGVAGFHVVTRADGRNVRFYSRCGLAEVARTGPPGGSLVLLGQAWPATSST